MAIENAAGFTIEDLIVKWEGFFDEYGYRAKITNIADVYPEEKSLFVDFEEMDRFDTELAEHLLDHPNTVIYAAKEAMKNIFPTGEDIDLHFRIKNLPKDTAVEIRKLRSKHLGKFIAIEGLVRKATEVRPKLTDALFRCMRCNAVIKEKQEGTHFKEPLECYKEQGGCGRAIGSTKFELLSERSLFVDVQKIEIQENPEGLRGGAQPQRLTAWMEDDISGITSPGDRVVLNGTLRNVQKRESGGFRAKSTLFDIFLDTNSIELKEYAFEDVKITPEEEKEIREAALKKDLFGDLIGSISPAIYGMNVEKEALALQLFGGVPKHMPDGMRIRGDIHILLVGDPGTAKCVSGDTKVLLNDGSYKRIDKIVERMRNYEDNIIFEVDDGYGIRSNHNILSLGLDCKNKEGKANILWKRSAPKEMLRVATSTGKKIKVTFTHPFFVCNGANVEQKKAMDLRKGDFIATPRRINVFGVPQSINVPFTSSKARNAVRLKLPKKTSPNFWRFVALFIGEGYLQLRSPKGYPLSTAFFSNNDLDLVHDFFNFAKELGLNPSTRNRKNNVKEVIVCGIELGSLLKNMGVGVPSREKEVPSLLFSCSKKEIAMFLSTLFDCEGTVSKKSREIKITSASRKLLEQVQHLLLRFEINSQLHEKFGRATNSPTHTGNIYYHLYITGEDVIIFQKEIDFSIPKKKRRLRKVISSNKVLNTNIDIVPFSPNTLKNLRMDLRLTQFECSVPRASYQHYEKGDRKPSHNTLRKITKEFENRIEQLLEIKKNLINGELDWSELRKIRESLHTSQKEIATISKISQGTISQYEIGKIGKSIKKPKKKSINRMKKKTVDSLLTVIDDILRRDVITRVSMLKTLANSDIFWDRIESIEEYVPTEEFVYDLQVPTLHNFIANDFYVHNSQILAYISQLAPRGIYASGKASSAAGLTAAAVKDEFGEGRWTLEAGALVLADMGIAAIDELDKMSPQDRSSMHEAMEQQRISVAKAGIQATLQSRCSVLGAANPRFGRFDEHRYISEQIDLPPALLSRFDLIFPIIDKPSDKDADMADHILRGHLVGEMRAVSKEGIDKKLEREEKDLIASYEPTFDPQFFRKYIAYAKRISPVMKKEAMEAIKDYYLSIRKMGEAEGSSIPITPRQLEAFVRLSEASARARLSKEITLDDAGRAIRIVREYLKRVAGEAGGFDIDILMTGTSKSQREQMIILRDIIQELTDRDGSADIKDIIDESSKKGISEGNVQSWVNRWSRDGEIYESSRGRYRFA